MATNNKTTTNAAKKPAAKKPATSRFTPANRTGATAGGDTPPEETAPEETGQEETGQEGSAQQPAPAPPAVKEQVQDHPVNGAAPQPGNGVAHREDVPPPPALGFPGAPIFGHHQQQQERHQIPVEPASFLPPPPPVSGYHARPTTQVIGLRTDKARVDWWVRNLKIVQGYYNLPDGVIPDIAAQMLVQGFHEVLRAAVLQVHGEDIGPAPKPQPASQPQSGH